MRGAHNSVETLARKMCNLRCTPESIIFAAALLLLAGCHMSAREAAPEGHPLDAATDRIEAVVLDARSAPSDSALRAIAGLGTTHLALVSFGFQESADDPQVRFRPDVRWFSESEEGARALARRAGELGIGIILKPQIWIRGGVWTADIDFESEEDWIAWEDDYRAYLLHTARVARDVGAELLIVGTELANPVREREAFWRNLIEEIRTIYDGRVTYGANWHDDYRDVPFWDALDVIGIQAYFPLAAEDSPELETIREGWRDHIEEIRTVSARERRAVMFTEVGYRSVPYAAQEPWRWPSRTEDVEPDYRLQADLYRAFFESVWERQWFAGAIIWKLYPESGRRGREIDFTPQGKSAEEVIRGWFMKTSD